MDTSQYDAKIQAAIDEKSSLQRQMDELCATYINTCSRFFASEFQEVVERAVTSKPEIAQQLGLEKLRELKAELKKVVDDVPQIVSKHLDKDTIWEHRRPLPEGIEKESLPGFDLRHNAGKKVEAELHEIMGHVGRLIINYGLDEGRQQTGWERRGNGLPRYRYAVAHNIPDMNDPIKRYKELFDKFVKAHVNIIKAKREKEEAIAKDLWNQA